MAQCFRLLFRQLIFCLVILCLPLCAAAQGAEPQADAEDPSQSLSIGFIKQHAEEIAASNALDDATKASLAETYRRAIGSLESEAGYRDEIGAFERVIETGPNEIESLRARIAAMSAGAGPESPPAADISLADLEQQLRKVAANRVVKEAELAELKAQLEKEAGRPDAIRRRLAEAEAEIDQLTQDEPAQTIVNLPRDSALARSWMKQAQLRRLRMEILKLEQESASLPIRLDLLRAQRELADLELGRIQRRAQSLESAANARRQQDAHQAAEQARAAEREAASKPPAVVELAARNTSLSEQLDRLASAITKVSREELEAAARADRIEETFSTTQKKIEVAGLSQAMGLVLQEQRRSLPDIEQLEKRAKDRANRFAEATLSQIVLEEESAELRDLPAYVEKLASSVPAANRAEVSEELRPLAESRRSLVDSALSLQRTYLQHLGELDFTQNRLADAAQRFDAFLDKRLLWVRSSQRVGLETIRLIPGQLGILVAPDNWNALLKALFHEFTTSPWIALTTLFALLLRIRRPGLLAALRESGSNVGVIMRDRVSDTLRAFGIIALLALPWAFLIYVIGHELRSALEAKMFTEDVGRTLMILGPLLFELKALHLFVAPHSIADLHFGWRKDGLQRLYRDLSWFTPALMAVAALTIMSLSPNIHAWGSGLGRASFLLTMALFAAFFYRLARPTGGAIALLSAHHPEGGVYRLRTLWFLLLVGPPLMASAVALAGFMLTAGTIFEHILNTGWFVLLVILVHQSVVRWLVVNQRKLRLQAILARREAEQGGNEARQATSEGEAALVRDVEQPEVDFKALDATSRKMVNNILLFAGILGTWFIWEDMLPALRILDDVTLWTYSKAGVDEPVPITLASIGLAIVVLGLMFVATRQLPAFLEIALLQRLKMSQGSRYTALTLTKYVIVAFGVIWIFNVLGGSWSEFQWIFAALGVGIGFGLQEIVANFISGLIILFERPIRVGDVVTVGNTDGVVTRIRIRATTIRNWDRKELLVPNKNFITQELLNWSLSDQTTRVVINVGVAYGSDVEQAIRIMQQVAANHPRVLPDPEPIVVFEQFGDNALQLSLRCFMDDIDIRLRVTTDLNLAINRGMAEAGIEIAFPQRDVHLDTRRPLDVRIQKESPEGSV
jgi:potassium efflux system protein